jgi:nucleotide-binding universal stress UspA family protein
MTEMSSDAIHDEKAISRESKSPAAGSARPFRILAPVDGPEGTNRILKYLLDLRSHYEAMQIIVLNTQPEPQQWRMRGYGWFHREAIHDRLINDLGRRSVESAGQHLDAAGIPRKDRIELGEPSKTIVRCALEEDCDMIVLAERDAGTFRRWLMRTAGVSIASVASIVIQFSHIPVVVVR